MFVLFARIVIKSYPKPSLPGRGKYFESIMREEACRQQWEQHTAHHWQPQRIPSNSNANTRLHMSALFTHAAARSMRRIHLSAICM